MVASTYNDGKKLVEAKLLCEKNDNGIKKYYASVFNQTFDYANIMYHLVPGVTSMSVEFKIADTFNLRDIRYSVIEGINSVRSSNQQFTQVKHEGGFYVSNIKGIECSQKTIMMEVYDVRLQMILMKVMLRTDTKLPKPELAFFVKTKNGVWKDLFNETIHRPELLSKDFAGFLKTDIHPVAYEMGIEIPGYIPFFWPGSKMIGADVDKFFAVIDTALTNDSLTKTMYIRGFRYKLNGSQGVAMGTSITLTSIGSTVKDGKIEYKRIEVLNKKAKLRFTGKQILLLVLFYALPLTVISFIVYFIVKRRNRRQKKKLEQQNEIAKLKLQGVRSQLNPHFVFNALAGIQNLMNKNETVKANNYLASFSRITRSVLDNSAKEFITIADEEKLLTDYLQMEQLRFGFQYSISVNDELDKHNIEIPAMLLQPFIENAVKHGISSLKENGFINVEFNKSKQNVLLSVTDNGAGFDTSEQYEGMGLQLSKSRITLLNKIYKETPVHLSVESSGKGTKVVITLNNWI